MTLKRAAISSIPRPAFIDELLEGLELIRRVHVGADHVLGEADLRGDAVGLDQARDRLVSLDPLLLGEDPERLAPALAGGDEIPARLFAFAVSLWLDDERLQEPVCRDARGELLEPDLRAGLADIVRRGLQLVERDVLRDARDGRFRVHVDLLCTAPTPTHSTLADAEELETALIERTRGAPLR